MRCRRRRISQILAVLAPVAALATPARANILNPNSSSYTANGALSVTYSGTNSNLDTITTGSTPTLTYYTSASTTASDTGQLISGVAVFDFASISITAATFTVSGSYPLALLAYSNNNGNMGAGTIAMSGESSTSRPERSRGEPERWRRRRGAAGVALELMAWIGGGLGGARTFMPVSGS